MSFVSELLFESGIAVGSMCCGRVTARAVYCWKSVPTGVRVRLLAHSAGCLEQASEAGPGLYVQLFPTLPWVHLHTCSESLRHTAEVCVLTSTDQISLGITYTYTWVFCPLHRICEPQWIFSQLFTIA